MTRYIKALIRKLLKNAAKERRYKRLLASLKETSDPDEYSMLPFYKLRCIFVHIPKTAGLSVCHTLFGNRAGGHQTIEHYKRNIPDAVLAEYFKFCFIRNPWDRIFSAYNYLSRGGINEIDNAWAQHNIAKYKTFQDFVEHWLTHENIQSINHFRPQHKYIVDGETNNIAVDFFGMFEHLADDFRLVSSRLYPGKQVSLNHRNRTAPNNVADFREAYTENMRAIVAEIYSEDISLFGYTFDNSSTTTQTTLLPRNLHQDA